MIGRLSRHELESIWAGWNLPTFNGFPDEDARAWLAKVDGVCQTMRIPVSQRVITATHFLGGSLKGAMKSIKRQLKSRQDISSCQEMWDAFKDALVDLHNRRKAGDEADYLKLAGSRLVMAGTSAVVPSLGILGINAVGFTSSGVAAGSIAATIQSVFYGASTGGLFSIFQSIGATAVVAPPLALGLGVAAIGTGLACHVLSNQGGDSNPEEGGSSGDNAGEDGNSDDNAGDSESEGRSSDGNDDDNYDESDFNTCHCSSCLNEKE